MKEIMSKEEILVNNVGKLALSGLKWKSLDDRRNKILEAMEEYAQQCLASQQPQPSCLRWVKASERKWPDIETAIIRQISNKLNLVTDIDDIYTDGIRQSGVFHQDIPFDDLEWLDESSPSPSPAQEAVEQVSERIKKFVQSIQKETGMPKALIMEAFCQNDYKFDKDFVINFVRTHARKF